MKIKRSPDAPPTPPATQSKPSDAAPSDALSTLPTSEPLLLPGDDVLQDRFAEYLANRRAKNTFAAYAQDWKEFSAWMLARGRDPKITTPGEVAAYLTYLDTQNRRVTSIRRAWYGIKFVLSGSFSWARERKPPEVVATVLDSIERIRKEKPTPKRAFSVAELARLVEPCGTDLRGVRDRAILLLGWFGMMRRSEVAALEVRDAEFVPEGLKVTVRSSKTDQTGKGLVKAIHAAESIRYCAVVATRRWLAHSGVTEGRLFRAIPSRGTVVSGQGLSGLAIWSIVKTYCRRAGLEAQVYGAHSLRSGGITASAKAGNSAPVIMKVSGHNSIQQVTKYMQEANLFDNTATKGIGPK